MHRKLATFPFHRPPSFVSIRAGCGNLWFANLSDIDYRLIGIDRDREALEIRQKKANDLHDAICGDLYEVTFEPARYDVIYNAFVLEHVEDLQELLERFKTWLKPGGLLILKIPDRDSAKGFVTADTPFALHVTYYRYYRGNPNAGKPGYMPYPTPFHQMVSRRGIHAWAHEAGMLIEDERERWTTVDDSSLLFQGALKTVATLSIAYFGQSCHWIRF